MSEPRDAFVPEPERFEFHEDSFHHFDWSRRDFFKLTGSGVAVFLAAQPAGAQESGRGFAAQQLPQEISAWLHIGEEGGVTVFTGKVEVGQNIRTSLAQSVADELRVPFDSVRLVMGDTARTPWDMGTFGSRTTPTMAPQLRRAANALRDLLIELAAKQWNAAPASLSAADAKVTDPATGRSASYADLARGQSLAATIPSEDPVTPASQWTVAGRPLPKVDGRDFVTGRHLYTPDMRPDGVLCGKLLRPPAFGATLTSVDTRDAQAIPGVTVVHDGDFVGVAAPRLLDAERAIAALHAEWKTTPQPSSAEIFDYLKRKVEAPGERNSRHETGSVDSALAQAAHRVEATYTVSYIAHAPLEPRAALAEWENGKLTVWTGTQRPFAVRDELASAFHVPQADVRVIVPDTGSAYGGKHTGEVAVEAARLARAANRPVSLLWTREEEFTWAYFRPAGVIEVKAGVASDGRLQAWEFHNYNSGPSAISTPYAVPSQRIEYHPARSPLRQGSYRGLAATANHFAREMHMDVAARAAGLDPLEFRLKNLEDARLRAVFEAAARSFGWPAGAGWPAKRERAGQGFGMGGGVEKGSYLATFAEVAVDRASGEVRVVRVVTAFECGAIVNPDGLRNQVMGATVMALGGALFEAVEFENGRITNPKFSLYRVPRFRDLPQVEVVLLDRKDLPSAGAGETPIVGLAPAVGNAIFDATGVRLRALPLVPNGLKA
ncbi:MAG TPA: molybdopterin cofactor-binding domain-containing protein [Candidatus Acidoferrales bacterium]|nr:molybdopterin cofactor-binding domain-containing protein [Candidatus Acidoferrales bacterium]